MRAHGSLDARCVYAGEALSSPSQIRHHRPQPVQNVAILQQRLVEPGQLRHVVLFDTGELRTECLAYGRHVNHAANNDQRPRSFDGPEEFVNHVCFSLLVPLGFLLGRNLGFWIDRVQRRYPKFSSTLGWHLDIAVPYASSIRQGFGDAFRAVLGFFADHIDRIAISDLPEEVMEPESEQVAGVVRGDATDGVLNLMIYADHDRDLIGTKIQCGFHAD